MKTLLTITPATAIPAALRILERKATALAPESATPDRGMKRIVRPFLVKEIDDDDGTFSGIAAAYSLDQGGDVILPGAFKRTLADWRRSKGKTIPLIDTHNYHSATAIVGKMIEAKEVDDGLEASFKFIPDDPTAEAIRRRVKGGFVSGLSIGYEAMEVRTPTDEERRSGLWRYLKEVKLLEVSVVAFPMNGDARIDLSSVKGYLDDLRARGVAAADVEEVKRLHDELGALLASAPGAGDPPPAPTGGLALDDPKRIALEAITREVFLRHLGIGE